MKSLLLVAALCLVAGRCFCANTLIQSNEAINSGSNVNSATTTVSFTGNTAGNDLVLCFVRWLSPIATQSGTPGSANTVLTTPGVTWTTLGQGFWSYNQSGTFATGGIAIFAAYMAPVISSSTVNTAVSTLISSPGAIIRTDMFIMETNLTSTSVGTINVGPVVQNGTDGDIFTSSVGNITPANGELVVMGVGPLAGNFALSSGWTSLDTYESYILTSTGSTVATNLYTNCAAYVQYAFSFAPSSTGSGSRHRGWVF